VSLPASVRTKALSIVEIAAAAVITIDAPPLTVPTVPPEKLAAVSTLCVVATPSESVNVELRVAPDTSVSFPEIVATRVAFVPMLPKLTMSLPAPPKMVWAVTEVAPWPRTPMWSLSEPAVRAMPAAGLPY
jgi:hypothetical protein